MQDRDGGSAVSVCRTGQGRWVCSEGVQDRDGGSAVSLCRTETVGLQCGVCRMG